MSRTKWKGPIFNTENKKKKLKFVKRNEEIVPNYIGLSVGIHNGKKYTKLTVNEDMLGYKFGAFSLTREQFFFKKKKSKK